MKYTTHQEFYKLVHRKITWIMPIFLLIIMIIASATFGSDGKFLFVSTYASGQFIPLVLVMVGSTFFSMEFQNNTILTLIYKSSNKIHVYLSKLLVLFTYNIAIHLFAVFISMIFGLSSLNGHIHLMAIYMYHQNLLVNMAIATLLDIFMSTLVISFVFLISCIINSNSIVTLLGISLVIFGSLFSNMLLNKNINITKFIKWNPFNTLNLTPQYYNYTIYHDISHLSNFQITISTLLYTFIFIIIGYLIFRKKRF